MQSTPLSNFIQAIKTDVVNSIQSSGRYATGATIAALEEVYTDNTGTLLAPLYIDALEYGRKPTSAGAPAGEPTVYEQIQVWAVAKGIPEFSTNDKGKEVNVWRAITESIHKNGYKGKPGVLTTPLSDDNINYHVDEMMEQIALQKIHEISDYLEFD